MTTDLNALREELRADAQREQNHLALHLFAEGDALREMIVELAAEVEAAEERRIDAEMYPDGSEDW